MSSVASHLYCPTCGYDVFGLSSSAKCPECGGYVAEALADDLASIDPATRQRMHRGSKLLLLESWIQLGTLVGACLIGPGSHSPIAIELLLFGAFAIIAMAKLLGGAWVVAGPLRDASLRRTRTAIGFERASAVALILCLIERLTFRTSDGAWLLAAAYALCSAVGAILLATPLREIARRAGERTVQGNLEFSQRLFAVAMFCFGTAMLCVDWSAFTQSFAMVAGILGFLAFIWAVPSCVVARKQLCSILRVGD